MTRFNVISNDNNLIQQQNTPPYKICCPRILLFSICTIGVFTIQHIKLCLLCFVLFALFALTATTVAHNTKTLKDMLIVKDIKGAGRDIRDWLM